MQSYGVRRDDRTPIALFTGKKCPCCIRRDEPAADRSNRKRARRQGRQNIKRAVSEIE